MLFSSGFAYDANHPFHLHGYNFRVIGMDRLGKNITKEKIQKMDNKGLLMRNLKEAPIKDTVTVPDGGYTIIRFIADNPGKLGSKNGLQAPKGWNKNKFAIT